MKPLSRFTPEKRRRIKYIFSDIDGTLTDDGFLGPDAYSGLWELKEAGFKIIPVSGGGAGTAVHAARAWPVDAVVTESGALAFYKMNNEVKILINPAAEVKAADPAGIELIKDLEKKIRGFKLAADQFARIFDIAVDYHEQKPYLSEESINDVIRIAGKHGAKVRRSSIHLNIYFGNYDKLEMVKKLLPVLQGIELDDIRDEAVYIGDAPNDEEMFRYFPLSIGVANIIRYSGKMKSLPSFITQNESGKGFREAADFLLGKNK